MELSSASAAIELSAALTAALAQPRAADLAVATNPLAADSEFSRIMKLLLAQPGASEPNDCEPSADPVYAFAPCTLLVPRKYNVPATDRPRRRQQQREK